MVLLLKTKPNQTTHREDRRDGQGGVGGFGVRETLTLLPDLEEDKRITSVKE